MHVGNVGYPRSYALNHKNRSLCFVRSIFVVFFKRYTFLVE